MKTRMARMTWILPALLACVLAISSLASCSGVLPTPPPPPATTTFAGGADPRSQEAISVGPVRVFSSDYLNFRGETKLPDGTPLTSQLYENGQAVPWWPAVLPIITNNGTWEARVTLGINGAPAKLAVGPQYLFKIWQVTDPSVQGLFSFDLVGPPAIRPWWQQIAYSAGHFFSDLFHGRLWRSVQ